MRRLSSGERGLVGGGNVGRSPAPPRTTLTGTRAVLRRTGLSPELQFPLIVCPHVREYLTELALQRHDFLRLVGADAPIQPPAPAKTLLIEARIRTAFYIKIKQTGQIGLLTRLFDLRMLHSKTLVLFLVFCVTE